MMMDPVRDYRAWHQTYDDPDSALSWRLRTVRVWIHEMLDRVPGSVRVLSACAGDGRDVLGTLADRRDAERVQVTLVEIDPDLAQAGTTHAEVIGLSGFEVRMTDAGVTDAYVGAVPADLVLLVGILGNISSADVAATVAAAPQLCAPAATCLWSRGLDEGDTNDDVRAAFTAAGFVELQYAESAPAGDRAALGAVRYDGPPVRLRPGEHLFTFLR